MRFWQDKWCKDHLLKDLYPELYSITANKDASITSFLEHQNDENVSYWNVRFNRDFNDWELESIDSMLELLYSNIPRREGFDRMRWKLNANGKFDVHSYYAILRAPGEI